MRGYQVSRQLQRNGIRANVIDLSCNHRKVKNIKNSTVIFVKNAICKNYALINFLKENKNTLIWDIVDCIMEQYDSVQEFFNDEKDIIKIFNGVIFPNHRGKEDWSHYFKSDCFHDVIYHHWDPRLKPNRAKNYQLAYIGGPENLKEEYADTIRELSVLKWSGILGGRNLFRRILDYNCHFSVRGEGTDDFNYKSNTKLSCASATNSNIVLTRDPSFAELLDSSYPYYTSSDMESVKKTVRYSKETYQTEIWYKALDMMREVRERTSIGKICKDYIQYLSRF